MSTEAKRLEEKFDGSNFSELLEEALAIDYAEQDQDWDNETTYVNFSDGSQVAFVSGTDVWEVKQ